MRAVRSASYESNQFTLGDLRQILEENNDLTDDTHVDLRISKADPPYARDAYYIEIG